MYRQSERRPGVSSVISFAGLMLVIARCTEQTRATTGYALHSSCKEVLRAGGACGRTPSGEYSIRTSTGRVLDRVYCEMGLDGGGYTFLHPIDLLDLTSSELKAMFTDTSRFLLRARLTNGTQPYGVLKQIQQFSGNPLTILLNNNVGYTTPINAPTIGSNYLFYGFIPASLARLRTVQGLQVNGVDVTFTNCDGNPNSYIATFPNFCESTVSRYAYGSVFPMFIQILTALRQVPSTRTIPEDYFTFFESHFGGCGLYTQSDGRPIVSPPANSNGIISMTIGFR